MNYKVIPYTAVISGRGTNDDVAKSVEETIQQQAGQGWEFVSCGNIDTVVKGSAGCFGVNAKPDSLVSVLVLVFKK